MGVDLAAQPAKTAVCLLAWPSSGPEVLTLCRGRSDDQSPLSDKWLSGTISGKRSEYPGKVTKVGIDDPFGWPVPFLDALAAHREAATWPTPIEDPLVDFRFRETDKVTKELSPSGRWPLSVSSDRIAVPAMRCARLLADVAAQKDHKAVVRDGAGLCCEVYPDPALRIWTAESDDPLAGRSYKRAENAEVRVALLEAILTELPIKDPGGKLDQVKGEDDYLDALVCALVARAVELKLTDRPGRSQKELARIEGWIHLPRAPLSALGG